MQNAKSFGVLEIEGQALLVAGRQLPPVVRDLAGDRGRRPPRIAGLRRLDLDHLGAEVREDRCRRRTSDPARAIDDLQTCKYSISHPTLPLLREQSCHSRPAHGSPELVPNSLTDDVDADGGGSRAGYVSGLPEGFEFSRFGHPPLSMAQLSSSDRTSPGRGQRAVHAVGLGPLVRASLLG